jgi:hypothetical protein
LSVLVAEARAAVKGVSAAELAGAGDAVGALRALAVQLAAAYEADPGNALLARELRMTLQALVPAGGNADGGLGELFSVLGEA